MQELITLQSYVTFTSLRAGPKKELKKFINPGEAISWECIMRLLRRRKRIKMQN